MLPLGTAAPNFSLNDPDGNKVTLQDFADSPVLVVAFICNHCPYVIHLKESFAQLVREYQEKGVDFVGINSNDPENYPDDNPEKMKEDIGNYEYTFPYLIDDTQKIAKAFKAACTPEFYVFDGERKLVYRGQFDDSRPGNDKPVTGADLRAAIDATLEGRPVSPDQSPGMGCNIKWKPGNEPDYFG